MAGSVEDWACRLYLLRVLLTLEGFLNDSLSGFDFGCLHYGWTPEFGASQSGSPPPSHHLTQLTFIEKCTIRLAYVSF